MEEFQASWAVGKALWQRFVVGCPGPFFFIRSPALPFPCSDFSTAFDVLKNAGWSEAVLQYVERVQGGLLFSFSPLNRNFLSGCEACRWVFFASLSLSLSVW